jgi:hypothetical protein
MRDCTFKPNAGPRLGALSPAGDKAGDAQSQASGAAPQPRRSSTSGGQPVQVEIFQRHVKWVEQRDRKLAEARVEAAQREVEGCTFAPRMPRRNSISGAPGGTAAPSSIAPMRRNSLPGKVASASAANQFFGYDASGAPVRTQQQQQQQAQSALFGLASSPPAELDAPGVDTYLQRVQRARQLAYEKSHPPFADGSRWTGNVTRPQGFQLATSSLGASTGRGRSSSIGASGAGSVAGASTARGSTAAADTRARKAVEVHTRGSRTNAQAASAVAKDNAAAAAIINAVVARAASAVMGNAHQPSLLVPGSSGASSAGSGVGAGAQAGVARSGGLELSSADDIRARLRQLEANAGSAAPAARPSTMPSTITLSGTQPPDIRFYSSAAAAPAPLTTPMSPDFISSRMEAMASAAVAAKRK